MTRLFVVKIGDALWWIAERLPALIVVLLIGGFVLWALQEATP